jgi:LPXTG-site transpeptidase (sortase) family protein
MKSTFSRLFSVFLLLSLLLAGVGVRPAYAAGYVVNSLSDTIANDSFCTLREAIQEANNGADTDCPGSPSSANDTITFSVSGTITLTSGTLPNIVSGQGTLTINGGGNITISGGGSVQVMVVNSGANLTLQNLTIANGNAGSGNGGGILNDGTLTVTNSTFSGNSADFDGGGIFNNNGSLTVTNSTFSNNNADYGGGILNDGTLTVTNSTFSNNNAYYGGGILNYNGALTVTNSTFAGNSATYDGGGIYNYAGTLTVTNSTFSNNSATNDGGGIYNDDSGTLSVTKSTFSDNSAGNEGGGILNYGTLTVTNATFSGNSANYYGGGIENYGTLTVTNSTFSGNSVDYGSGGGIYNDYEATLNNTIIANSTGGDCRGSLSGTNNNNLIEDTGFNACGLTNGVNDNIIGFDPDLDTLTGSPAYFPLNTGSLAIDAGDNPTCAAAPVSNQSQNNVTRPKDGDDNGAAVCDIGSYEAPAPTTLIVSAHSLQASYSGSGPASFTVTFNKDADNPPGNSGADDVTNPANYLLIEKGANSAADTASCAGGLAGDDTPKTVTAVSYNNATFTSTVTLAGALPVGSYRLFVCGTTSIVTASDNTPLNNGATDFTFDFVVTAAAPASGSGSASATSLPGTGFPIGRVTSLPAQPLEKAYAETDMRLQIPSLGVDAPIVGVLKSDGSWDVSWLGTSVGWLEGSAFPTWSGNTVLTGHVWNADNTPGVFAGIKNLKYGDRFTIRAYGQTYVYEVRENTWLWGASRVDKVFQHEEKDWVTLLTCEGYNPLSGKYLSRRIARAVLVEVK